MRRCGHYRRGGLFGKLVRDCYWFSGWDNTRSQQEFALLQHLRSAGVNVPQTAGGAGGQTRPVLPRRPDYRQKYPPPAIWPTCCNKARWTPRNTAVSAPKLPVCTAPR